MSTTIEPGTDLVVIETLNALVVFAPGGVEDVLTRLEAQARAAATDASTPANRKHLTSLAYKVARSKTALDKLGKDLTDEWRMRTNAVNEERRTIRDRLVALADEVRAPLTAWENRDKARIEAHERALAEIPESPGYWTNESSSGDLRQRLAFLRAYPARDWEEFSQRAATVIANEIARTEAFLAQAEQIEAEAAEVARQAEEQRRVAAEEAARLQAEREAQIAAEAASRAQADAEAKAAQEAMQEATRVEAWRIAAEHAAAAQRAKIEQEAREAAAYAERERAAIEDRRLAEAEKSRAEAAALIARVEQAKADAAAISERVERDRLAAIAHAETDRQNAIEAERRRVATEQATAAREAEKRAANLAHQQKIHRDILAALALLDLTEDQGKAVITAIARGDVPHVKIEY